MFAFTDMVYLFPNELSGLRAGRLSFRFVFPGAI
jgi:hypothetical protein